MARVLMTRVFLAALISTAALNSARTARADEAEDKAVKFVESLGGKVTRDDDLPGKPVVGVSLFYRRAVTDADLKELAPLKNLTELNLVFTAVTSKGLKELAPLTNLTTLDLRTTRISDEGLKDLAPLKKLTKLSLSPSQVSDKTLAGLREANLLHALSLAEAAGGKRPAKPEDVTTLDLFGTRVTDEGLKELTALKNLTRLDVGYTKVTDEGIKKLQEALPACKIVK